jgi:hypothetical protein
MDFTPYTVETTKLNAALQEESAEGEGEGKIDPSTWGYVYAGSGTAIVTVLRQWFAGFWFHPVGIILGPSEMMRHVWGSVLLAWLIRGLVLKLGGAATVRNKLKPFFIGVFLSAIAAHVIFGIIGAALYFFSTGTTRHPILF